MVEEQFIATLGNRRSKTIMERVSDKQVNFEVWDGDELYYEGANYFDSKGRISKQIGVIEEKEYTNYFVYEKNLIVENYQEGMDGQRISTNLFEYETFDETGNWTLKYVYTTDEKLQPAYVITRELAYY